MGRGVSPVQAAGLLFGYLALYLFGYIFKPTGGIAAMWPAHAVSFAALVLFPMRRWLLVIGVTGVAEFLLVPLMHWIQAESQPALALTDASVMVFVNDVAIILQSPPPFEMHTLQFTPSGKLMLIDFSSPGATVTSFFASHPQPSNRNVTAFVHPLLSLTL